MLNDILNSVNILSINLDLCWQIGLRFDSEEGKGQCGQGGNEDEYGYRASRTF